VLVSVPFGEIPVAEAPSGDELDILRLDTSADHFRKLNGHRTSNLSLKRNLGLLLARYRGWRKIMFLDDDIIGVTQEHVARVAHHLDSNRFAGLRTLRFEDNSVVCHANRLAGKPQGIFVSGAGVGVNTADGVDIEVFPEAYNEDWFAFAADAADAGVAHVGDVGQLEYNPFEDPRRAAFEEFGDLIAEGLFALFNDGCGLHRATELYWERFIDERRRFIEEVRLRLLRVETHERVQATRSLWEARLRLDAIGPNDCKAFLEAWQEDRSRFARAGRRASRHCYEYGDAFAALGVKQWQEACFGVVSMPTLASVSSSRTRR
jgi:hypothetical protein